MNPEEHNHPFTDSDVDRKHADDMLDEALMETFPASDPLPLWSGPVEERDLQ